jgi:hypothetical protein
LANRAADIDAVHAREHEIQENDVGARVTEGLNSLGAVGAEDRLEALAAQNDAEHLGQSCVIVDDENSPPA